MRKLKFQLDRKSLQTIYFSFIRPLQEYAGVADQNKQILKAVQEFIIKSKPFEYTY